MTKTVLLYGDSIYWGLNGKTGFRHNRADRVDTVIQQSLGKDIEVVSEGLRGRTMFGENGFFPKRDGLVQYGPILGSHLPVDVVAIMLGVNDLNTKTRHTAKEIANALSQYETETKFWCDFMRYPMPKFLVISPGEIDDSTFSDFQREIFEGAASQIDDLAQEMQIFSEKQGWAYLDPRSVAKPVNTDGIHLDAAELKKLGEAITEKVSALLS